jgi:hypothetical protein
MGNSHPQPGSNEFAAEFQRIEAAISCEEAKFELQRDTESLRQLHLQLIDMKIACAKVRPCEKGLCLLSGGPRRRRAQLASSGGSRAHTPFDACPAALVYIHK